MRDEETLAQGERVMVTTPRESMVRDSASDEAPYGRVIRRKGNEKEICVAVDGVPGQTSVEEVGTAVREALRLWTDRGYTPNQALARMSGPEPGHDPDWPAVEAARAVWRMEEPHRREGTAIHPASARAREAIEEGRTREGLELARVLENDDRKLQARIAQADAEREATIAAHAERTAGDARAGWPAEDALLRTAAPLMIGGAPNALRAGLDIVWKSTPEERADTEWTHADPDVGAFLEAARACAGERAVGAWNEEKESAAKAWTNEVWRNALEPRHPSWDASTLSATMALAVEARPYGDSSVKTTGAIVWRDLKTGEETTYASALMRGCASDAAGGHREGAWRRRGSGRTREFTREQTMMIAEAAGHAQLNAPEGAGLVAVREAVLGAEGLMRTIERERSVRAALEALRCAGRANAGADPSEWERRLNAAVEDAAAGKEACTEVSVDALERARGEQRTAPANAQGRPDEDERWSIAQALGRALRASKRARTLRARERGGASAAQGDGPNRRREREGAQRG